MSRGEAIVVRIATYNVHRCRGMDRRTLPRRIADVLRPLQADVIALQEVIGTGPKGHGQDEELGAALGMGWIMAPARYRRGHLYGNVVMSRFPIVQHAQYDLTWRNRTRRCCQRADVMIGRHVLHVYNVHLGAGLGERRYQTTRLGTVVDDHRIRGPKIVMGDFNEWGRGLASTMLTQSMRSLDTSALLKRRRTYPGFFPLLHLDHIYYDGRIEALGAQLPRTRASLIASDHLPLVADLRIWF